MAGAGLANLLCDMTCSCLNQMPKNFIKYVVKDAAASTLHQRKEYLNLQERPRCDSYRARTDASTMVAPLLLLPSPARTAIVGNDIQAKIMHFVTGVRGGVR